MTKLTIRWERTEDNSHHEETWERDNDGILYTLFMSITALIHITGKVEEGKDEGKYRKIEFRLQSYKENEQLRQDFNNLIDEFK
jgi:hypothetical protein